MSITALEYFEHLKDYLNLNHYKQCLGDRGEIILKEKVRKQDGTKSNKRMIFKYSGDAFAIKLDKGSNPLFHFLCNTNKKWSKRCDFIIFNRTNKSLNVYCIECKSHSESNINSSIEQLSAGQNFCQALHKIIKAYTGYSKKYNLRKFVFSTNANPVHILAEDGLCLKDDRTVRHYCYDAIDNIDLKDLINKKVIKVC